MKHDEHSVRQPSWPSLVAVCRACRKRSKGPKTLKAKAVAAEVHRALRQSRPRPRVVLTGCLGLCPKAAISVARVGGTGPARIVGIERLERVAEVVPSLLD